MKSLFVLILGLFVAISVQVLLRDFEVSGLDAKEKMLRDMVVQTQAKFPEVKIAIDVKENYKNMKEV